MNFTPLMAHRYMQNQINDMSKTILAEKKLNEAFREDFSSLQHFKFFCQDLMNGLENTMKLNQVAIKEVKESVNKQKHMIERI